MYITKRLNERVSDVTVEGNLHCATASHKHDWQEGPMQGVKSPPVWKIMVSTAKGGKAWKELACL